MRRKNFKLTLLSLRKVDRNCWLTGVTVGVYRRRENMRAL